MQCKREYKVVTYKSFLHSLLCIIHNVTGRFTQLHLDTNTNISPIQEPRPKPRQIPNKRPPIPRPRPVEVPVVGDHGPTTQPTPITTPQPAQRLQTNVVRNETTAPIPLPRMLQLSVGVGGIGPNCDQDHWTSLSQYQYQDLGQ